MSYKGATLTWNGRLLMSYEKDGTKYAYTYNADNLRTGKSKYVNNTLVSQETYIWSGDVLIATKKYDCAAATSDVIRYLYDSNGESHGFTYNGNTYLYVKNLQGDVIAIISAGDELLCLGLNYDPWGKVAYMTDEEADEYELQVAQEIAEINNIAYRGYFYDSETGLCYLQSRYYDPEVGRFINADDIEMIKPIETPSCYLPFDTYLNANVFAYCDNCPVVKSDPNGQASKSSLSNSVISGFVAIGLVMFAEQCIFISGGSWNYASGIYNKGVITVDFNRDFVDSYNTSISFYEVIDICRDRFGNAVFSAIADVALEKFKELYYYQKRIGDRIIKTNPKREFLFTKKCVEKEIKEHFYGYMWYYGRPGYSCPFKFWLWAMTTKKPGENWRLKILDACVEADIHESDVSNNTKEAIGFSYYSNISKSYIRTDKDPYYYADSRTRSFTVRPDWETMVF